MSEILLALAAGAMAAALSTAVILMVEPIDPPLSAACVAACHTDAECQACKGKE